MWSTGPYLEHKLLFLLVVRGDNSLEEGEDRQRFCSRLFLCCFVVCVEEQLRFLEDYIELLPATLHSAGTWRRLGRRRRKEKRGEKRE